MSALGVRDVGVNQPYLSWPSPSSDLEHTETWRVSSHSQFTAEGFFWASRTDPTSGSLLLGSAAGLVAVAGAQAADLPVKAKPVEYVKICSLYGVGFYYIPGTDMCLKIGGWVRAEYGWGVNGSSTQTNGANPLLNNRPTNNSWWRVRGYITADARNQTEYGTVRGYIAVGVSSDDLGSGEQQSFNANRAFIQWAGFTFGRAASFYDFYAGAAVSYFGFYPQSDTGDGGKDVLAYTAQFGNGFSASIAAELPRRTQLIWQHGQERRRQRRFPHWRRRPDKYGLRRLPGSGHRRQSARRSGLGFGSDRRCCAPGRSAVLPDQRLRHWGFPRRRGHPDDKWGFAVSGGLKLNAPMIGAGDYFQTQINYTQGALKYIFQNPNGNPYIQDNQNGVAIGLLSDGVFGGTVARWECNRHQSDHGLERQRVV